ncbi:MAG: tetratricopeptide repeat protein [Bacteroidia bacterium]
MKKYTFYLMLAATLFACSNNQESLLAEIRSYDNSDKLGTEEGLKELASLHKAYGSKYKDAEANNFLYAAAQYYFYENNVEEAAPLLAEYITRDDSTERFRNAAINLAILKSQSKKYNMADELISEVLDRDVPSAAQWQDIIKIYNNKIEEGNNTQPTDYERLTMAHTAVGRFPEALKSLDAAISSFPEYENKGDLIYRAGFISWEYLKDEEAAKKYYTTFLSEYPEDAKAPEVRKIIESGMLSMSNEDIIKMFKGE